MEHLASFNTLQEEAIKRLTELVQEARSNREEAPKGASSWRRFSVKDVLV